MSSLAGSSRRINVRKTSKKPSARKAALSQKAFWAPKTFHGPTDHERNALDSRSGISSKEFRCSFVSSDESAFLQLPSCIRCDSLERIQVCALAFRMDGLHSLHPWHFVYAMNHEIWSWFIQIFVLPTIFGSCIAAINSEKTKLNFFLQISLIQSLKIKKVI